MHKEIDQHEIKGATKMIGLQVTCFNIQKKLKLEETEHLTIYCLNTGIKSKRVTIWVKCIVPINRVMQTWNTFASM